MRIDLKAPSRSLLPLTLAFALGATACGEATSDDGCAPGVACDGSAEAGKGDSFGEWLDARVDVLDSEGDTGHDTAIAVDDRGIVHVTYYDATNADLRYVRFDGEAWSAPLTLDAAGDVGAASAIALGAAGELHVTYRERGAENDRLKYLFFDGHAWQQPQYPTEELGTGRESALLLDDHGVLHVLTSQAIPYARNRELSTDLIYLRYDGSSWSAPQDLDQAGANMLHRPALAIDANGALHAVWTDGVDESLNYARSTDSGWSSPRTLDSADGWGDAALTFDEQGHLHVVYWAEDSSLFRTKGYIRHTRFDGTAWSEPHVVYESRKNGGDLSIDQQGGTVYLSFFDAEDDDLFAALFYDGMWDTPRRLDGHADDVGAGNAIDVDATGALHVSYYDAAQGDLKYYNERR